MSSAPPPTLLDDLRAEAEKVVRRLPRLPLGMERADILHAGWVGYAESKAPDHAGRIARAYYSMWDEVRKWFGGNFRVKIQVIQNEIVLREAIDDRQTRTLRTKLPRRVKRALRQLSSRERRVLKLWTFRNYTHNEIAELLKFKPGTSARIRSVALARLRVLCGGQLRVK